MKLNKKKEALLKELNDVNHEVFEKVHEGISEHDIVGNDFDHFWKAMRYVPNRVIKKWIKNCKEEVKQYKEENE